MERWQNKIAVVTGASSGIGAAVVKDLVNHGLFVIGLARRVECVEELKNHLPDAKKSHLVAIKCDVSDLDSVNRAFDEIISKFGAVDILINNAGCLKGGQLVNMDVREMQQILQTNVMGVIHCTQRAFKSMKERNFNGHVVIVNSIAGHKVPICSDLPEFNIYPPSKFAITAITELLRQEFKGLGTKIKVTSISPGAVDTDIIPDFIRNHANGSLLKAEDISSSIVYALSTPPHVQIHELMIKPVGEMF
ncbi:farnesol dehydrogenase-like [Musca vetustissima]|uniref:farnesol dehydrogenase-like n=1 Tax=Musca vetustissima TaxID=27455 RepID=UPI002AB78345|nr:farnesol dehydrogenase-like [Musca vetustissima]